MPSKWKIAFWSYHLVTSVKAQITVLKWNKNMITEAVLIKVVSDYSTMLSARSHSDYIVTVSLPYRYRNFNNLFQRLYWKIVEINFMVYTCLFISLLGFCLFICTIQFSQWGKIAHCKYNAAPHGGNTAQLFVTSPTSNNWENSENDIIMIIMWAFVSSITKQCIHTWGSQMQDFQILSLPL